jgi:hypothetical protein
MRSIVSLTLVLGLVAACGGTELTRTRSQVTEDGGPSTGGVGGPGTGGGQSAETGGAPGGGANTGGAPGGGANTGGSAGESDCCDRTQCYAGDEPIAADACPAGADCYQPSYLCCVGYWCMRAHSVVADAGACSLDEANRRYAGKSPEECSAIRFDCQANTTPFWNECGCGCEQDPSCPAWVDCMPTFTPPYPPMDPLCGDHAKCPFTLRAL